MERVEVRLRNLYENFIFRMRQDSKSRLSSTDQLRYLGGMESLLQTLEKLPSGIPWNLQPIKRSFLGLSYQSTETYAEFILRNCREQILLNDSH